MKGKDAGSSPLTRGKQHRLLHIPAEERLIPAHAGKTDALADSQAVWMAHPRSRGENTRRATDDLRERGSSPLTRGKLPGRAGDDSGARLIPAHAGKTVFLRSQEGNRRAHPRSRGENSATARAMSYTRGSSPLTRGKHLEISTFGGLFGLIPAHAGKTPSREPHHADTRAHPRSRGENTEAHRASRPPTGSSPLTRGKLPGARARFWQWGLIPAHAGKTGRRASADQSKAAHPRSRGENYGVEIELSQGYGSSPLTRGKPKLAAVRVRERRLIPAHAGKTRVVVRRAGQVGAHPRSRGENRPPLAT